MAKFRLPLLNSLPAFEAAARHQSIRKACDELHVDHAAVSRHIKKLERQIGGKLFVRYHRQVVLTDAGEILYGAVSTGFSHIQRAFTQLSRNQNAERLVISVDPDFAGLWLVPRLAEFYSSMPNTPVEILAEKASISTYDSRAHCAILYAAADLDVKNAEPLFRSRLFPVCAKNLGERPPLRSPADLRHHVLLHDRALVEWEEYLRNCAAGVDIDVRSGIIFSETNLCLEAAVRGQGVALGDDFLAAGYLAEGRLIKPFGSSVLSKNAYYFLVSDSSTNQPSVTAFRAWLLQTIRVAAGGLAA